jgi:hypothetical protein
MIWVKRNHKHGDTRVIKRFSLFPITIHTAELSETRWLEVVYIRQRRTAGGWEYSDYWLDEAFVDWDAYYDYIETGKVI